MNATCDYKRRYGCTHAKIQGVVLRVQESFHRHIHRSWQRQMIMEWGERWHPLYRIHRERNTLRLLDGALDSKKISSDYWNAQIWSTGWMKKILKIFLKILDDELHVQHRMRMKNKDENGQKKKQVLKVWLDLFIELFKVVYSLISFLKVPLLSFFWIFTQCEIAVCECYRSAKL